MNAGDWLQAAAVLGSLFAALAALWIARRDRRAAVQLANLQRQLDAATRLSANLVQGGTSDSATPGQLERARMGAEALVLAGVLGPTRIPKYWAEKVLDDERLRHLLGDRSTPDFMRGAIEAQLAVNAITREMECLAGRPRRSWRRRHG